MLLGFIGITLSYLVKLFFFGQFFSLTGSWLQQTAQSWLVYRLTKDPLMLGLMALVGQFPVFLLGFYAGFIVDRHDHLRIVRLTHQKMSAGRISSAERTSPTMNDRTSRRMKTRSGVSPKKRVSPDIGQPSLPGA